MTPPLPHSPVQLPPTGPAFAVQTESVTNARVVGVERGQSYEKIDDLAVEEPLAIAITYGPLRDRSRTTISVTMRTPGNDRELAAGFLFAEGVVSQPAQILALEMVRSGTTIRVDLHPEVTIDLSRLDRLVYTSSACGICGKTSIDAVESVCEGPRPGGSPIPAVIVHTLSDQLRECQLMFARTGGIHAAALFDATGKLLSIREDVGRHNAVDKLIGAEFLAGRLPLDDRLLLVSGRAGFELIQKAAVAGVPVFAAVGAPSSLAVGLAHRLGLTLIGFLREGRFNIYTGAERISV
jgi:FdhD protein